MPLRATVWWGNDEPVKGFPTHLQVKSVGFKKRYCTKVQ
jgi:hypothetical protein